MKILDRYILKEFICFFLLIITTLTGVYLIIDFFERIRMFLSNGATLSQMGMYFFYITPTVISQMIPATMLLASLLTFGSFSRNNELTAMKANGISLHRASLPVLIFAATVCIFVFLLNEFVTPYANGRVRHIEYVDIQKRKQIGSFKQNQIWYRGKNAIYNISMIDPHQGIMKGIRINYVDRGMRLVKRIDAREARWINGGWNFHDVIITTFSLKGLPILDKQESMEIDIPETPFDFTIVQKDSSEMGFLELREYINKISSEGYSVDQYLVDLHGKASFAFLSIIVTLLGIAFSLTPTRSGGMTYSLTAGIIIGFSYWIVFAFSISLGRSGTLPPYIAAWAANFLFGGGAAFLFLKIKT